MPGIRLRASAATRSSGGSVDDEIAHLRDLDLAGLRRRWQTEFGRTAPQHLTRYLLFRILAYKLQADRFGDLDADTVKTLDRVGGISQTDSLANEFTALHRRRSTPQAGTVLVREWDRASHHVIVTPDGFAWNGKTFESLSQVAFAIMTETVVAVAKPLSRPPPRSARRPWRCISIAAGPTSASSKPKA